jgi:hypothetical protein
MAHYGRFVIAANERQALGRNRLYDVEETVTLSPAEVTQVGHFNPRSQHARVKARIISLDEVGIVAHAYPEAPVITVYPGDHIPESLFVTGGRA